MAGMAKAAKHKDSKDDSDRKAGEEADQDSDRGELIAVNVCSRGSRRCGAVGYAGCGGRVIGR